LTENGANSTLDNCSVFIDVKIISDSDEGKTPETLL
jgi:hypothetical protein